jgi:hypothetical protein
MLEAAPRRSHFLLLVQPLDAYILLEPLPLLSLVQFTLPERKACRGSPDTLYFSDRGLGAEKSFAKNSNARGISQRSESIYTIVRHSLSNRNDQPGNTSTQLYDHRTQ